MLGHDNLTRRKFIKTAGAAGTCSWLAGAVTLPALRAGQRKGGIERIEPAGVLIQDCLLAGETRQDDFVPAHPNGIRASKNRWLLIYATRGFRGVDDDCSIIYQIRDGEPDGRLVKEGMLVRAITDWDPFGTPTEHSIVPGGEGRSYVRQHGHPVLFGVPRGALIKGKPAQNANVFVAKWRRVARILDNKRKYLEHLTVDLDLARRTQSVEWAQFRLNDREDDIEIIQAPAVLRQKNYETEKAFCSLGPGITMNQSFTQAVPFNADCTEWADCNHVGGREFEWIGVAPLRYKFNPALGRYEWIETGLLLRGPRWGLAVSSLARYGDSWVISARSTDAAARERVTWARYDDLFGRVPATVYPDEPRCSAPLAAYTCPDGILRLCSGSAALSPYKNARDPLYMWDIDPNLNFASSNRRVIFDSFKAGLPIRPESAPKIDMCKLLSHWGRTQIIAYRVSVRSFNHPYVGASRMPNKSIPIINDAEKASCAIYYSRITYSEPFVSPWDLPSGQ